MTSDERNRPVFARVRVEQGDFHGHHIAADVQVVAPRVAFGRRGEDGTFDLRNCSAPSTTPAPIAYTVQFGVWHSGTKRSMSVLYSSM